MMKSADVQATFPELLGRVCHAEARGRGSSKKVALCRALTALLKTVGRHQWTTVSLTATVVELPAEETNNE
jgi:hypothetical protein